jgi:hypothetical protein
MVVLRKSAIARVRPTPLWQPAARTSIGARWVGVNHTGTGGLGGSVVAADRVGWRYGFNANI